MKQSRQVYKKLIKFSCFIIIGIASHIAVADPISNVARLSFINNAVSFSPAGLDKWAKAEINRPLITGDRLWTDAKARAELQLEASVARLNEKTYLKILNLNNDVMQFQVTSGTLALTKREKSTYQSEVSTPNAAIIMNNAGYYRIDVRNNATYVTVRDGEAIIYGKKSSLKVRHGLICQFTGTNLEQYRCSPIGKMDDFDRWAFERDEGIAKLESSKYVSESVIGYVDLERHGKWTSTKNYGHIWFPQVRANWVPYRQGHWVWVRHYGWTWIDNTPWGFAPFHYGRWTYIDRRWGWIPGPVNVRAVYAPALVVFVGRGNFLINARRTGIGWFPLGPGAIYIPPYQTSINYFTQINVTNTTINTTYINNIYNNPTTPIEYENINISEGITAIPTEAFIESQPVEESLVTVPDDTIEQTSPTATVSPDTASILGGAEETQSIPQSEIINQPAVVKNEPPAPTASFEEEKELLDKNPGQPLSTEETQNLKIDEPTPTRIELVDPQTTPITAEENTQEPIDPAASPQEISEPATAPADVPQPPAEVLEPAADVVQPPADVVQPPADVVQPPADVVQPPADVAQPPADVPEAAPADTVQPPADTVQPPADTVQPPADVPEAAPADTVQPPADVPQPSAPTPPEPQARPRPPEPQAQPTPPAPQARPRPPEPQAPPTPPAPQAQPTPPAPQTRPAPPEPEPFRAPTPAAPQSVTPMPTTPQPVTPVPGTAPQPQSTMTEE